MTYKKSRYNVEIEKIDDCKILMYNTKSGFLGIMNEKTKRIYNNIEDIDVELIEDQELKDNIVTMFNYGYIVDKEYDELASFLVLREKEKFNSTLLSLTIAPTMACNMRCPYCYEDKKNKFMSKEIQDEILKFISFQFETNKLLSQLEVNWYGGEPLLQTETIYSLSKRMISFCSEKNISYKASMVTNGVLLNLHTAKKLKEECNVGHVQITVDGMPNFHDKRRIFVDGKGSFDIIMENIENIRAFMPITLRMNVDKENETEVAKLFSYLTNERKWNSNPNFYIAPVDKYSEYGCLSGCFSKEEFAPINLDFLHQTYMFDRLQALGIIFRSSKRIHCGAEQMNSYVIDPDGYYYKCWVDIGNSKKSAGHISKPYYYSENLRKWLMCSLPEKCKECIYLPMCQGGCGISRMNNTTPKCVDSFYNFKNFMRLAYKDYISQKR